MTAPKIVVTLSEGALAGLETALHDLHAVVVEHPLLTFEAPDDWTPVDQAIHRLSEFDAVALTSPRAASRFGERVRLVQRDAKAGSNLGDDGDLRRRPGVWAAGAATSEALGARLGAVRLARGGADDVGAASLARAMIESGVRGPVLFPCGDIRRDELPALLAAAGIAVNEVCCYRARLADAATARDAVRDADVVVAGSPRVAALLAAATEPNERPPLVAIGPTTAAAARAAGWMPTLAERPTASAVATAIRGLLAVR